MSVLQWGCNFIVTEIVELLSKNDEIPPLQWGCNFIVTEIITWFNTVFNVILCFNGAVTLSLQKFRFIQIINELFPLLQWGCNFIVTEI